MAKTGYAVTISGTLPVDVSSKKDLQKLATLISTAEAGDASGILRRLEDVTVDVRDGNKPGRKAKRKKAKAGGAKRGPKPKQGELPFAQPPGGEATTDTKTGGAPPE